MERRHRAWPRERHARVRRPRAAPVRHRMSSRIAHALRRFGRWLEPVLAPDAQAQRTRLERLAEQSSEEQRLVKTLVSEVTAHRAEVRKLIDARRADSIETQARFNDLRASVRRQESTIRRLSRRLGIDAELEL